jgi:hypothetical protein
MLALPIIVVILLLSGATWAYRSEKKTWNNGICAQYNEPWVQFDTDSQGGRGYKCRDQHAWISWPVDKVRPTLNRSQS